MRRTRSEINAVFAKDRELIASDGTRLAYTVTGEDGGATPVVFMNGWTCSDAYWRRVGPAVVDAGHPCLFFDTRGHGCSGLPRPPGFNARHLEPDDVSVARIALDLAELAEAAGFERAVFVGHSMGVQAIFELARIAPERIAGLVPVAGTYENPVPTFADQAVLDRLFPIGDAVFRRLPLDLLRYPMTQAHRLPPGLTLRVLRLLRVANEVVTYDDVRAHVAQFCEVDMSVLWRMMSAMRNHSAADVLPKVAAPVLILGGAKDTFTPPSVQRRMADLVPDAELVLFPAGGHLLPVEEAAAVADRIVDWLARRVDVAGRPTATA